MPGPVQGAVAPRTVPSTRAARAHNLV